MTVGANLDARVRALALANAYEAAAPFGTEAARERALVQAHSTADRAMCGLDEWLTASALFVARDGRRRGFPDHLAEAAAKQVFAAIGRAVLEDAR